ncbi:MAG TPA: Fe-S protein assembly co-chaperone HscB [Phnomibacter sp.]|nr:Fe-S protein assembly co-chaperone HscB [Phnomibacter sp.]
MNYFELYQIPPAFQIDRQLLTRRYLELQKQYHPDYFTQASPQEQAEVLEKSSAINQAYRIFTNPHQTIKYLLTLKGLLEEEEKYTLPPDFLMEVMELNEAKMEGASQQEIASKVEQLMQQIKQPVANILANYQEGQTTEAQLLQVKQYYFQKNYLDRLLANQ